MSSGATLAERAQAGARFLDHLMPNWAQKVDLETLDIGSAFHCVLGQLWSDSEHVYAGEADEQGGYFEGLAELSLDDEAVVEFGFWAEPTTDPYPALTTAWKAEVWERQRTACEQELEQMLRQELVLV